MIYDPFDTLAKGIVKQAVDDWRSLVKHGIKRGSFNGYIFSYTELRSFFKSDWCRSLVSIDTLVILEQLEKEKGEVDNEKSRKRV